MDKYTVDLDKVLNDFEYSELTTDQHVRPHSYNNNNNNRVNKDVTKHSINNVFHSLNEYLNTDVSDGSDVIVADNNCDEVKETIKPPVVDLLSGDDDDDDVGGEPETIVVQVQEEESAAVIVDDVEETVEIEQETEVVVLKEEEEEEEAATVAEEVKKADEETVEEAIKEESVIVGFNQPVELEEAELDQYFEELKEEEEEEEKIDENKTEESKAELDDKNGLTRPDSLPLDNIEQKKDINLIGMC